MIYPRIFESEAEAEGSEYNSIDASASLSMAAAPRT